MKLSEYITRQIELLEQFEREWTDLHEQEPELYPLELQSGDWDEQFIHMSNNPQEQ